MTGNFEYAGRQVYVWQARGTSKEKLLTLDTVENLNGWQDLIIIDKLVPMYIGLVIIQMRNSYQVLVLKLVQAWHIARLSKFALTVCIQSDNIISQISFFSHSVNQ